MADMQKLPTPEQLRTALNKLIDEPSLTADPKVLGKVRSIMKRIAGITHKPPGDK